MASVETPVVEPPPARSSATFVSGSLLRHILVMTGTGAIGLVAIFVGDLANMLFLSWLGDEAIIAAIGYASSILFFATSIGIGLSIATTSLVSPAIGAGSRETARRLAASSLAVTFVVSAVLALVIWLAIPGLLTLLGAVGRAHGLASDYLRILVPFLPPLALAMTTTAILRSVGDARRAMNVTLIGAVANIVLDPFLIFGLGLGIHGAAIASAIARLFMLAYGIYAAVRIHNMVARPNVADAVADTAAISAIAVPAILTNVATPVANAYVTAAISPHGDSAVAAWAIIGRIIPVAFGAIYALSGSVGPIIGQNFGAGHNDRMRETLTMSLFVTAGFAAVAWMLLAAFARPIAEVFGASGDALELIVLFCRWLSPLFVFLGFLFVSNAVFNTLGRPHFSTLLNWGRATLGTIPFVEAGAAWAGAPGILAGNMAGSVVFGVAAVWFCYRLIDQFAVESAKISSA